MVFSCPERKKRGNFSLFVGHDDCGINILAKQGMKTTVRQATTVLKLSKS